MGRPSKFKPEFVEQARKLALLGATDEQIAFFFDVDVLVLANWAWNHKEFFDAITPSDKEVAEFNAAKAFERDKRNARRRKYMAENPSARLRAAAAARVWAALKGRSDGRLFSRLGYSVEELAARLESQFVEGMSWDNYGDWHVDHKKPCVLFDLTNPVQFSECWSLNNLQPLWASENIKKGASYAGS